ncbi:MAG: aldo/keto reductase, partial [Gemmatimonadales bacterium]
MNRRLLGRTDFAVSETGFGAWAIGGNQYGNSYGPTDDRESIRAVRRAVELGCNFFDTADVYGHGHSEEILGEALAGVRQHVIIATKVGGNFYNREVHPLLRERIGQAAGVAFERIPRDAALPVTHDANFTPAYIRFAVAMSLGRLRTDYIDVLQLHNPPPAQITAMETYGVLEDLKQEGLIRAYGVSVHSPDEGLAAIQSTMPDTIQLVYNLARREAESAFFPAARAANLGV